MDGRDTKALQGRPGPQWDVSQTAFNSAGALRDLIRAVSYDDVQPQALLAAEALGLGFLVSPIRINEAIIALKGEESVKWDRFKVLVGLQSKGTIKTIRNSTALAQFFVVVTACKLCYTDVELGDIFFDIISESGVLSLFPVASSQLARLISTMSGHCDIILPINLMHDIAVAVDAYSGNYAFYQRLNNSALATLICKIFEHLRDETVEHISITGCQSGLWLSTALFWLLPDDTNIMVDDKAVKGNGNAKMTITLTRDDSDPSNFNTLAWKLQTWRSEGDPTTFILETKDQTHIRGISEIPMRLAKSMFHHNYELPVLDLDGSGRRDAISVIGALAQTLITYITENGTVFVEKRCCKDGNCARVPLMSLQSEEWIANYSDAIIQYGWDSNPGTSENQTSAAGMFKQMFAEFTTQNATQSKTMSLKKSMEQWTQYEWGKLDEKPELHHGAKIIEAAITIATHAIASSICNIQSGNLKLAFSNSPLTSGVGAYSGNASIFAMLSKQGLEIGQLRRAAMLCVFPYASLSHTDLALSQDGLVAGWGVMWNQTTIQRHALQLNILRGTIQREGFQYERIAEEYREGTGSASACHNGSPLVLFHDGDYVGMSSDRERVHIATKYTSSAVGNSLEITTLLKCRDESNQEEKRSVSWISAMSWLACATHIERPNLMSSIQEEAIARILHNKPLEAYWVSVCHNNVGGMTSEHNIVLRSMGNEELRFWAAAVLAQRSAISQQCLSLFVRHTGPLISSLNIAAKADTPWALIC
jgi:hypothetical protein